MWKGLLLSTFSASSANGASEITATLSGRAADISDVFFGINNGEKETNAASLSDATFIGKVADGNIATYRYPGGTVGNYWDWRQGCQTGKSSCGQYNNKVEDFAKMVKGTGAEPVLMLNMLTSNLTDQLDFLAAAAAAGISIRRVELGNEYDNAHDDFEKAYPTGADYGREASRWIKAISKVYPEAVFAVVGAPAIMGHDERKQQWNAKMFPELSGASAVTMHEYHDSRIGKASEFKLSMVETMLGAPFYWMDKIEKAIQTIPAGLSVWLTEFNFKDDEASGTYGTWAQGLFVATEVTLFLQSERISTVNLHCAIGSATTGALFSDTSAFDFDGSPDKTLVTETFGRSAAGWATSVLARAFKGQTSQQPLAFSTNPQLEGADGKYPSLLGAALSKGPKGPAATIINLGPDEQTIDLSQLPARYTTFQTVSAANPTHGINKDDRLTVDSGSLSSKLKLPPYSVSALLSWSEESKLLV